MGRVERLVQISSALVVICWWAATFGLTVVLIESDEYSDCFLSARGRIIEFIVGVTGCSISTYVLLKADAAPRWLRLLSATVFVAWLAFVVAWLPSMRHDCLGQ